MKFPKNVAHKLNLSLSLEFKPGCARACTRTHTQRNTSFLFDLDSMSTHYIFKMFYHYYMVNRESLGSKVFVTVAFIPK